jgi:hypothetical protein
VRWQPLTVRVEAATSRLLHSDRQGLLLVVKATVASAGAFELARTTVGSHLPALAAMSAIITVQVSASQTTRRAVEYSAGVAAGVIAAILLTRVLGVHWWSISLLTLLSLLAGRLIRLGSQANQIAISALLVMSLGSSYGWNRIIDTLIGAGIGIAVSLTGPQPSWDRAARSQVAAAATAIGVALRAMSVDLRRGGSPADVRDSLEAARNVSQTLADVRRLVDTARDERRVPLAGRRMRGEADLDRFDAALPALDHVTNEVRSIGRSLLSIATEKTALPETDRAALADLLAATASAINAWGSAAGAENPVPGRAQLEDKTQAVAARRASLAESWRSEAVDPRCTSILVEIDRIIGELDPNGAHGAAIAPPSTDGIATSEGR